MKIVLVGGGSGGHIIPLLATANALKHSKPGIELIYIGDGSDTEQQLKTKLPSKRYTVRAGKWRRYPGLNLSKSAVLNIFLHNVFDLFKLAVGFIQSLWLILRLRPDCVFCKGGYATLPVGLAAILLRRPLVIHESDSLPGISNRVLGRFAKSIATGWPAHYYPKWPRAIFTGVPITMPPSIQKSLAGKNLGLSETLPVILFFGGSQGAQALNKAVRKNLVNLTSHYQIIHITGVSLYAEQQQWLSSTNLAHPNRYKMYSFLNDQFSDALLAATVIVARAGMNTIAEIAAFKRAFVVVPHPQLADQLHNASILMDARAAIVLPQAELEERLVPCLQDILSQTEIKTGLEARVAEFAKPRAAAELAEVILKAAEA